MSIVDLDHVSVALRETAAEIVLPRFRHLETGDVREKKPGDMVTVADEMAEHAMTQRLRDLLPGSIVVGEEAVAADQSVLGHLGDTGDFWIIDPIDGTANFVAGKEQFGMMVALVRDGVIHASWIYDAPADRMYVAEKGSGAYVDGSPIRVGAAKPLDKIAGILEPHRFPGGQRAYLERQAASVGRIFDIGAAAHEYMGVATGTIDFVMYRGTWPWDHAPGVLMVNEAGGYAAAFSGAPYRITDRDRGVMATVDRDTWDALHALLINGLETVASSGS